VLIHHVLGYEFNGWLRVLESPRVKANRLATPAVVTVPAARPSAVEMQKGHIGFSSAQAS
jgi:hypothetical protein